LPWFSDLLALAHGSRRVEVPSEPAAVSGDSKFPITSAFLVKDRPGIVAEITGALAREHTNIRAIVQSPDTPPMRCVCGDRGAMQVFGAAAALAAMRAMDCLLVEPLDLQMLE